MSPEPSAFADAPSRRRSPWLLVAIACAAMLVLPAIAWLLVPGPSPVARPLRRDDDPVAAPTPTEPASRPRPVTPAPPRPAPPSASTVDPDAPVLGVVLDPEGRPAAGAFVGCDDRDQTLATFADDQGRFKLPPAASGCFAVSHHATGVPSDRVQIFAGRENTIRLNRGGSIEGDVVDEAGAPVPSFLLAVESYHGANKDGASIGLVKSFGDPSGAFVWEGMAPGTYVLTASAEARPPVHSRVVDVEAGRRSSHVRIVLSRGAMLSGRILDAATRKPIAGATVALDALTMTGANATHPARSDESGAYAIDGAPPGPFSIRVASDGYNSRVVSGLTTRGGAALAQDVELHPLGEGGPRDEFAGIGAVLAPSAAGVVVSSIVAGGPAEQAGLKSGDRLKRIDGADATMLPVSDCVQRLRGAEGSIVSVQVDRAGQTVDASIVRKSFSR